MEVEEINRFLDEEEGRLRRYYPDLKDNEKIILAMMVKIQEEIGELSEQVLALSSLQRKEKLDGDAKELIKGEIADVLISTMLLARATGTDPFDAMEKKMVRIRERY
jgi:NTP pyrophosphatase (non-canonical NTP hydrolase)